MLSKSVTSASSKLVTRGTVDQDRCICSAIVRRMRESFSRLTGPNSSRSPPTAPLVFALPERTTRRMSSRVMRPPSPDPWTNPRSTPTSRANRRIAGPAGISPPATVDETLTATGSGAGAGDGKTGAAGTGAVGAGVGGAACSTEGVGSGSGAGSGAGSEATLGAAGRTRGDASSPAGPPATVLRPWR